MEIRDELREKLLSAEESGDSEFNRRETIKKSSSGVMKVEGSVEGKEEERPQPQTMKPVPLHRQIDRETIFPSRIIEKKHEQLMRKSKKKSFWACCCPYLKDKKVSSV